ncbi:hypothetical protein [Nitrosomonas marina]|uniref:Uncharacterized protein n=1 Tax=Nitrosomonas marina TaxID=917 RepID=A0A1H8I5H6_9PROT|nr:hypothetical protein [Nitrosomonas marina]SEN63572.1 hypothetical protein SAMN05216325_12911 [Nitrosomonas marina]
MAKTKYTKQLRILTAPQAEKQNCTQTKARKATVINLDHKRIEEEFKWINEFFELRLTSTEDQREAIAKYVDIMSRRPESMDQERFSRRLDELLEYIRRT